MCRQLRWSARYEERIIGTQAKSTTCTHVGLHMSMYMSMYMIGMTADYCIERALVMVVLSKRSNYAIFRNQHWLILFHNVAYTTFPNNSTSIHTYITLHVSRHSRHGSVIYSKCNIDTYLMHVIGLYVYMAGKLHQTISEPYRHPTSQSREH